MNVNRVWEASLHGSCRKTSHANPRKQGVDCLACLAGPHICVRMCMFPLCDLYAPLRHLVHAISPHEWKVPRRIGSNLTAAMIGLPNVHLLIYGGGAVGTIATKGKSRRHIMLLLLVLRSGVRDKTRATAVHLRYATGQPTCCKPCTRRRCHLAVEHSPPRPGYP